MSNPTKNPPSRTPLRPSSDQETRVLPTSPEAEQALLGALFIDNKAYSRVAGYLRTEHFGWSVHGRIFTAIGQVIAAGKKANPANLKHLFDLEEALQSRPGYLMHLAKCAVTVSNVEYYAEIIVDLARRRAVIEAASATLDDAYVVTLDRSTTDVLAAFESRLKALREDMARDERDQPIDVLDFLKMEFPPCELVIDPWLPAKGLAMITGRAGIGKTLIALQLAWGIATGQSPIPG